MWTATSSSSPARRPSHGSMMRRPASPPTETRQPPPPAPMGHPASSAWRPWLAAVVPRSPTLRCRGVASTALATRGRCLLLHRQSAAPLPSSTSLAWNSPRWSALGYRPGPGGISTAKLGRRQARSSTSATAGVEIPGPRHPRRPVLTGLDTLHHPLDGLMRRAAQLSGTPIRPDLPIGRK